MKKVLIALDYDQTAKKIADSGYALAKALGAQVTLVHVIADPVYYSTTDYSPIIGFVGFMDTGQFQLDSIDGLKGVSQHFLDKIKHHLSDGNIQTQVKEGDFADAILGTAKEINADVIVIGSHSRRWLEEVLMGSVTEKVLHHTTVPLFIVPTKKPK